MAFEIPQAGDVIRSSEWRKMIDYLYNFFTYINAINQPQPIQVSKPSILLLEAEGTADPDFFQAVTVFLSEDNVIFEEVASFTFKFVDVLEVATLTVPIPKDYFVSWIAPYGFMKSAILF